MYQVTLDESCKLYSNGSGTVAGECTWTRGAAAELEDDSCAPVGDVQVKVSLLKVSLLKVSLLRASLKVSLRVSVQLSLVDPAREAVMQKKLQVKVSLESLTRKSHY